MTWWSQAAVQSIRTGQTACDLDTQELIETCAKRARTAAEHIIKNNDTAIEGIAFAAARRLSGYRRLAVRAVF